MYGRRGFLRLQCFRYLFLSGILGMFARLSGWLRARAACMHASIAVPRGGAWSASHPWISDLT